MALLIPSPEKTKLLRSINELLLDFKLNENNDSLVKACAQMATQVDFAAAIKSNPDFSKPLESIDDLKRFAWAYFYHHLALRDYVAAALILWNREVFTPEPHCVQLIWEALTEKSLINVLGAGSMSKTYSPSAFFLLQWLLDPEWTRVQVASNSEDHVKKNLYADMVRLHSEASLVLPGVVDSESISLEKKRGMGIYVLVIPGGPTSRGKLKGAKMKPRPNHPMFGTSSRLFILLDEAQEIPPNVFDEIPNLFSSMEAGDTEHIKIVMAANPKDEWSRYGQNCKPTGGFQKLGAMQETWESETGWHCVRLNAMLSENVIQRRKVFPRLITYEGVQKIIKSQAGGDDNHPTVWTFIRGMFPPAGQLSAIIKNEHLRRAEGEWIFSSSTVSFGAFDPAFTGDLPAFTTGRVGTAIGWIDNDGSRHNLGDPRVAIQVDAVGILTRGDTQDLADEAMSRCAALRIPPENFAIDKTGPGRGVHDVMRRQWAQKVGPLPNGEATAGIIGIEYAGSPTETKISEEDTNTPKDIYDRICSELWFAAGKLFEYDCVRLGRGVTAKTIEELGARRGGMKVGTGKKQSVESKPEYRARTGMPSPDCGDATLLMLHAARMTTPNLIPKAKDTKSEAPPPRDPWGNFVLTSSNATMRGYEGHTVVDGLRD